MLRPLFAAVLLCLPSAGWAQAAAGYAVIAGSSSKNTRPTPPGLRGRLDGASKGRATERAERADEPLPMGAPERALLLGMEELTAMLPDITWDRPSQELRYFRRGNGTLDMEVEYIDPSEASAVPYLYHSVLIARQRPSVPPDPEHLAMGAESLARIWGAKLVPLDGVLAWGDAQQCYGIQLGGEDEGTLCVAQKDRYTLMFGALGLLLQEPAVVDLLLQEQLAALKRYRF